MKCGELLQHIREYKFITHVASFLLGLFAYYITVQITNFVNRPIINVSLRTITIREETKGDWRTDVRFRIYNSGKTGTTVLFENVRLYFPEYSTRPISLKVNAFSKVDGMCTVEKSFNTVFPSVFDTLTMHDIPRLYTILLDYKTIETDENYCIIKEQEDIVYSSGCGLEYHGPEHLKDAVIDSVKGMIGLRTKEVLIEYEGRLYSNSVYPATASVGYRIEDGKIVLQYSDYMNNIPVNAPSQLIEPIIFLPHPELKDKIVYPRNAVLRFTIECRKEDEITYEDYEIELGQREKALIYVIKP